MGCVLRACVRACVRATLERDDRWGARQDDSSCNHPTSPQVSVLGCLKEIFERRGSSGNSYCRVNSTDAIPKNWQRLRI